MTAPPLFRLHQGESCLIVSIPHAGTYVPPDIAARLTPAGRACVDADFHVDRLYGFAAGLGATVLAATHSRTVADLNRPPDGARLYPGQAETGLCPTETFAGAALYAGAPPDAAEIATRRETYWAPYHAALRAEIDRVRARHGVAHLLDGHSIHGRIPRLFAGELPDLNLGTNDGASAGAAITARAMAVLAAARFSHVLNGRFKGGYITRHYGAPGQGVHALQLEMAWRAYLPPLEPTAPGFTPPAYDPARAAPLIDLLRQLVGALSSSTA